MPDSREDSTAWNKRRAKFYELTKAGRRQLEGEEGAWMKLTTTITQVVDTLEMHRCSKDGVKWTQVTASAA